MSIRFPKMHIATSVVNRILNAKAELDAAAPSVVPDATPSPAVPDPSQTGAQLDAALAAPIAPVDVDPLTAEAIGLKSLL